MASTTAKGSGSTVNNGGTIVGAGNVASDGPITKVISVKDLKTGSEYGSQVVVDTATGASYTDPHGVIKAKSAGTFAYTPDAGTNFLLRGAGDTNAGKINGSASSLLTVPGGATNTSSIKKVVNTTQLGTYATAKFDVLAVPSSGVVPGRTRGTGAGTSVSYVQVDGTTAANDDAATPTRSVPGELTYMFGAVVPKQDDYKAKNSYES